jgi:hypothetical protein
VMPYRREADRRNLCAQDCLLAWALLGPAQS